MPAFALRRTVANRPFRCLALLGLTLLGVGCQKATPVAERAVQAEPKPIAVIDEPPATPANFEQPAEIHVDQQRAPQSEPVELYNPAEPAKLTVPAAPLAGREAWDTTYIQGSKVGHFHAKTEEVEEEGRKLLITRQDGQMTLKRFGQSIRQDVIYESVETPEGELVRFRSLMKVGPVPTTCTGHVKDGKLTARIRTFGKESIKTIDWDPSWGGYFAAEQSSLRNPLKAGETRKLKALMAMSTDVAVSDITIASDKWEKTKVLDTDQELLKSTVTSTMPDGASMTVFAWTDKSGEQIKQLMPGMQLETIRTSREVALGKPEGKEFDLGKASVVRVAGDFPRPHSTKRVVYQVKAQTADPAAIFTQGVSQAVKSTGKNSAVITVISVRPDSPAELTTKPTPPTEDDHAANNLVQSDDKRVVELASAVAPEETDPWKLAVALEGFVHGAIEAKNFTQAFATAGEVANTLEGDCTEHAVLLAAVCRARKIPARVAIGLVYYPPMKGFGYHMWNEVWIKDRWVPLDSTLGQGGIGAAHLKLSDSNLKGASGLATFLPVAQVMGQLEVEVLEME